MDNRAWRGQHNQGLACLLIMAAKKSASVSKEAANRPGEEAYDLSTPRWSRYYQAMRKRIRFPRYYKKALNW